MQERINTDSPIRRLSVGGVRKDYYTDPDVQITSEAVRFGDKTFPLADIKRATIKEVLPEIEGTWYGRLLKHTIGITALLQVAVWTGNLLGIWHMYFPDPVPNILFGVLAWSIVLDNWIPSILSKRRGRVSAIELKGTFGTALPYRNNDVRYLSTLAGSINLALREQKARNRSKK